MRSDLIARVQRHVDDWRLEVEDSFETETSVISMVRQNGKLLVLKVIKDEGDEWHAGEIVSAFNGNGVVKVYERVDGAMLLERLRPGTPLVTFARADRDEEATDVLADLMGKMRPAAAPDRCPTVEVWARGFDRHLATGNDQIPGRLIAVAQRVFADLCSTQRSKRLLHGDLHHYNVLFDAKRGWLAIDPKGVIGELEYEVGAIFRNPVEQPQLFLSPPVIENRLNQLTRRLNLNTDRTLSWAFAQAVLSAIWQIEDGQAVNADSPSLKLARTISQIIGISEQDG